MLRRRILRQVPLLIIWLMFSALVWGFVFDKITDAPREHKIVVFADAEVHGAAVLETRLSGAARGSIRLVQVRPFTYAMMNGDTLKNADLYLVREDHMAEYLEWFSPCPAEFAAGSGWELDGVLYGVPAYDPNSGASSLAGTIRFEDARYFLCFGKNSLHLDGNGGAVDDEAVYFARILLHP